MPHIVPKHTDTHTKNIFRLDFWNLNGNSKLNIFIIYLSMADSLRSPLNTKSPYPKDILE